MFCWEDLLSVGWGRQLALPQTSAANSILNNRPYTTSRSAGDTLSCQLHSLLWTILCLLTCFECFCVLGAYSHLSRIVGILDPFSPACPTHGDWHALCTALAWQNMATGSGSTITMGPWGLDVVIPHILTYTAVFLPEGFLDFSSNLQVLVHKSRNLALIPHPLSLHSSGFLLTAVWTMLISGFPSKPCSSRNQKTPWFSCHSFADAKGLTSSLWCLFLHPDA